MTLSQFVSQNTGKAVSYDGLPEDRGQCEQLVCLYWKEVYGFECPPIPAAKDLWTNATVLDNFERIPVGHEQAGDVAVWGASSLINSPEYGHTDIVLKPGFTGFDSNWGGVMVDGYPAAHEVVHNYTDVLGFLRKKGTTMPTPTQIADQRFKNEQAIAKAVGFKGNPDDTAGIIAAINALKNKSTVNKTSVEQYIQEHLS